MIRKIILTMSVMVLLAGCSTITIDPKSASSQTSKQTSAPTYEDSKNFFLWGLAGEHHVDVNKVCSDKEVAQMQSQATFADMLLTGITLGIYAPHSVKVWCKS